MEALIQDLRYGLRTLAKNPGFTAVAVLTLALGIGANTAIFSVVNAVLLRQLPYKNPDRLVRVWELDEQRRNTQGLASYPNFVDWRTQSHVFDELSAFRLSYLNLTGEDKPAHLLGAVVSANLFRLLGSTPLLGRAFLPDEDKLGANRVVVLSHDLWQQRFRSDPNVLGRTIALNDHTFTVVGVMPAGFQFPIWAEPVTLWATTAIDAEGSQPITAQRGIHYLGVIARLKPKVTLEQAQAEMDTIESSLERQYPEANAHRKARIVPELEELVGNMRPALRILLGAVGCVLLVACANVANLLMARATVRHKEFAIRAALGASRFRAIRQLLTESVLLSILAWAFGLLLAMWATGLLASLSAEYLPRIAPIAVDGRVLAFSMFISLLTGVLFGLAPALGVSKSELAESLREGGRGSAAGDHSNRARSLLVVTEVALALVLLVGAGLLIRSLYLLQQVNPGFEPRNVLTLNLSLPGARYSEAKQVEFCNKLLSRLAILPGAHSASSVYPLPLSGDHRGVLFEIQGRPSAKGQLSEANYRTISPDYFRTMGIALVKGRDFTVRDDLKAPPTAIINETLARRFFPNEDPIGKRIELSSSTFTIGGTGALARQVVGVAADVKHRSLRAEPGPEVYVPNAQIPSDAVTVVVRTDTDPRGMITAVGSEVTELDKELPLYDVKTLDQYLAGSVARPRLNTLLLGLFAAAALALTAVGLYGVVSYSVSRRTHEIGVRMALGAQQEDVLKLIVREGMTLVGMGVGIGLTGALGVTRLLSSLLYGVRPVDLVTFACVPLLLIAVALLASYIPARRATKVDPMVALRYE